MEIDIIKRMQNMDVYPNDRLGQHILINEAALEVFAGNVSRGGNVLEIGSGPGNITERIAERAKKVVAVEIDRKFEPILSKLQEEHPNVSVVYKDVLGLNLGNLMRSGLFSSDWQLMSNLPFHITEPFLKEIIDLPITDAVLILGEQMVDRVQNDNPLDYDFSRTGLTVQTFFESSVLMNLPSRYFYPEPGTDSAIVVLTPREKSEYRSNKKLSILRHLFLTESKHSPVGKIMKEAYGRVDDNVVRDKEEQHRHDRRETKNDLRTMLKRGVYATSDDDSASKYDNGSRLFDRIGLSNDILNKPFSRLDNQDLRDLVVALDRL